MAYLVKHPKSRFWFAVWRNAEGKQIRRSTKEVDRKKAARIAREYEDTSLKRRTSRQVRQVIASLHREITGNELVFPTVKEYVSAWLAKKGPETSEATSEFYKKSTTNFLNFIGKLADQPLDRITSQQIISFRNFRAKQVAAKTANHDLKTIRMLFNSARKEGLLFEDPAENVDAVRTRGQVAIRRPFSLDELRSVMSKADKEWQSMIQFGLYAGMRLGDVAALTRANLAPDRNEIRYQARKTGKIIILPLAGPLSDHVKTLLKPGKPEDPLHPSAFASLKKTGKSGTLSNRFADLLAAAGLREKKLHSLRKGEQAKGRSAQREASSLSFHCLRHTAVSLLKEAGIPSAVVMELVGHDSEQMSAHYTHVGLDALAAASEKMPRLSA